MFMSYIIFILNVICLAASVPIPKLTLYDMILEKCPSVHSYPNYQSQQLFNTCKDLKTVSEIKELNSDNIRVIRCLLYFEAFTQYCNQTTALNLTVPHSLILQSDYNLENICNYAKTLKNLNTTFSDIDRCKKICTDEFGYLHSVCSTSFYFAHKKDILPVDQTTGRKETVVEDTPPNHNPKSVETKMMSENTGNLNPPNSISHSQKPKVTQNQADNKVFPHNPVVSHETVHSIGGSLTDAAVNGKINKAISAAQTPVVLNTSQRNQEIEQNQDGYNVEGNSMVSVSPVESTPAPTHVESPKEKQESKKEKEDLKPKPDISYVPPNNEQPDQNISNNQGMNDLDEMQDLPEDDVESPVDIAPKDSKPLETGESEPVNYNTEMEGDSYFFTYFMILCVIFIVGYVCYHNKQKILALILEGRRGKRQYRGRRPNSANYHKLDSNLEEAITSSCKKNTNNVIY